MCERERERERENFFFFYLLVWETATHRNIFLMFSVSRVTTVRLAGAREGALSRVRLNTSTRLDLSRTMCSSSQGKQQLETSTSTSTSSNASGKAWELRMLYDGDCPLCMREVNMLRRRDEGKNKIDFVDIASADYKPEDNQNISFEQAMGKIHAITRDGEVVTNIEVFRRLYDLVGIGWVFAITKVEPFGTIIDRIYDVWAQYRLPITGREDLDVLLAKRKECRPVEQEKV